MSVIVTMLGAWLVMISAPETPVAQWLRHWLVEVVARRLGLVTRGHVMLAFVLAVIFALVVWQFEDEGVRLLSMMAPEIATWVTMFEVTTWLDVAVAAITASSVLRLRSAGHVIRSRLPRRRSRARRVSRARPPANDDDGPRLAIAA